jgi:hypothetical protein
MSIVALNPGQRLSGSSIDLHFPHYVVVHALKLLPLGLAEVLVEVVRQVWDLWFPQSLSEVVQEVFHASRKGQPVWSFAHD